MSKQQTPVTDLTCDAHEHDDAVVTSDQYRYSQSAGNAAAQEALNHATGEISESTDGSWIRLWDFGVGSAALMGVHRTALTEVAERNASQGLFPTEIRGFASPEGGEDLNRILAGERAVAVSQALPIGGSEVVSCGEPSVDVDPSMYPYHRAVDVTFSGSSDPCEDVPAMVTEFLELMPVVFRLAAEAERKHSRLQTVQAARDSYDRLHANDELGVLLPYTPSNGMQDAMSGVADWVENGFDGERDGAGYALPRAIVSPIPMFGAFVWGLYAGIGETAVNVVDHGRRAMGSDSDRYTSNAELEELRTDYETAYTRALDAFTRLENLRHEVSASGCSDDATLRFLAEQAVPTFDL